ncbi:MAG: NAD(P)H-dependent oxidoreductase subunit E [Firmicutes bacterium]|nr:NAD(P)H-dependent oxidoreductase subunit E [Bacillota bacterium]
MTKSAFKKRITNEPSILTALQQAQEVYGYITPDAVAVVADVFEVSQSRVYSTATFYHQFTFAPRGKHVISVCMGTACYVLGAQEILNAIEDELGIKAGGVTTDGLFSIEHNTRCVGDCASAPIVIIGERWFNKTNTTKMLAVIRKIKKDEQEGAQ